MRETKEKESGEWRKRAERVKEVEKKKEKT